MAAFRRVDASRAGPTALGILVPVGTRTLVILRPRGLEWDLLPARWNGDPSCPPEICGVTRDEAAQVARRLAESLEKAAETRDDPLQMASDAAGRQFQIWLRAVDLVWVPCARQAGQAYSPLIFATQAEATAAGEALTPYVYPSRDADREYYFNTQKFA